MSEERQVWSRLYADLVLGKRLAQARESAGFSQDQLAELLGISGSAISQWEAGRTAPTRKRLLEVAQIVMRDPQWLRTGIAAADALRTEDKSADMEAVLEQAEAIVAKIRAYDHHKVDDGVFTFEHRMPTKDAVMLIATAIMSARNGQE